MPDKGDRYVSDVRQLLRSVIGVLGAMGFRQAGLRGVTECAVPGKSGLLDAFEVESGYAVENAVSGDQLQVERKSRTGDPAISLVHLLGQRMSGGMRPGPELAQR